MHCASVGSIPALNRCCHRCTCLLPASCYSPLSIGASPAPSTTVHSSRPGILGLAFWHSGPTATALQHVSSAGPRRAPPHHLPKLVVRAPRLPLMDPRSFQDAPRAHHRRARRMPTAHPAAGLAAGCSPQRCGRGADAALGLSFAALCGDHRKWLFAFILALYFGALPLTGLLSSYRCLPHCLVLRLCVGLPCKQP